MTMADPLWSASGRERTVTLWSAWVG